MNEGQPGALRSVGKSHIVLCFSQHVGWQLRGRGPGPAQDHLLVHGGAVWDFTGCPFVEFRLFSKTNKQKRTKSYQAITEETNEIL